MRKQNRKPGIHLHKTSGTHKIGSKFQTYHEYYWILIAKNGKTIARSSETYKTKRAAVKSIAIAAKLFAESVGVSGGHYYDHSSGGDLLNYDFK